MIAIRLPSRAALLALLLLALMAGPTRAVPLSGGLLSPQPALGAASFLPLLETELAPEGERVRFAVIGDYGREGRPALDVASLVKSWNPDFVVTTGDNNYQDGAEATIDGNIGRYYHRFIGSYPGRFGDGAAVNRFFPSLGKHDWHTPGAAPYLAYFTLPGNERYYGFTWGPVALFAVDSDPSEPDGVTRDSAQARWLQQELAASTACWKLVYMHHPPYSSGQHGSHERMQWPYAAWGTDMVLAGHDHLYERIVRDGVTYFVNGLGGASVYAFGSPVAGSQVRYNADYGAMLVDAGREDVTFWFVTRTGLVADEYTVRKSCP